MSDNNIATMATTYGVRAGFDYATFAFSDSYPIPSVFVVASGMAYFRGPDGHLWFAPDKGDGDPRVDWHRPQNVAEFDRRQGNGKYHTDPEYQEAIAELCREVDASIATKAFPNTKLAVRSPADLVAAVPYLVGHHPDDGSLVVVVVGSGRIVFVARVDLPDPDAPASEVRELAACLTPIVAQQQPITAIVGYGDAGRVDPALRTVAQACTAAGMLVRDLLRVTAGRWFSLTCDDPACCPPQGTPFDPTTSLIAVQATAAGIVALPDRAAIAARFAPVEGDARERMRHATDAAVNRLETLVEAGDDAVHEAGAAAVRDALRKHDGGEYLSDDEMAWLTLLLADTSVRDLAMELSQRHDRHVTFWAEVTRRAEPPLVPAPATLLAVTAWRCGDGGLAAMAAERALQADPTYSLADLLLSAVRAGLPPSVIEQAISGD
ncbi:hypothetical protein GCM10022225_26990 [Plantactinospora mayteni]|uniref:DUF4192 domain-containing protein n=1 Tax=Plantactinospora mayteni TaxID=566021 RepID=A0ABQ4EIK4_9ACTN|nr:DUF4192 domain-containing protein [Plantactinospora mayteni]GIG94571.1 hypothetical protein Pma05_11440 [Plantactinospora mayteni]